MVKAILKKQDIFPYYGKSLFLFSQKNIFFVGCFALKILCRDKTSFDQIFILLSLYNIS